MRMRILEREEWLMTLEWREMKVMMRKMRMRRKEMKKTKMAKLRTMMWVTMMQLLRLILGSISMQHILKGAHKTTNASWEHNVIVFVACGLK